MCTPCSCKVGEQRAIRVTKMTRSSTVSSAKLASAHTIPRGCPNLLGQHDHELAMNQREKPIVVRGRPRRHLCTSLTPFLPFFIFDLVDDYLLLNTTTVSYFFLIWSHLLLLTITFQWQVSYPVDGQCDHMKINRLFMGQSVSPEQRGPVSLYCNVEVKS